MVEQPWAGGSSWSYNLNKYQHDDYNNEQVEAEQISWLQYSEPGKSSWSTAWTAWTKTAREIKKSRKNKHKQRKNPRRSTWFRSLRLFVGPFIHIFMWSSPPTLIITFVIFSWSFAWFRTYYLPFLRTFFTLTSWRTGWPVETRWQSPPW